MELFALILAMALGATLALSGVLKLFDLPASARTAASVGILPAPLGSLFGLMLPFIELLLSAMLLTGFQSPVAGALAALLMLSFFVANRKIQFEQRDLACNCFGSVFTGRMGRGAMAHSIILFLYSFPLIFVPQDGIFYVIETGMQAVLFLLVPAVLLVFVGMFSRTLDALGEGGLEQ